MLNKKNQEIPVTLAELGKIDAFAVLGDQLKHMVLTNARRVRAQEGKEIVGYQEHSTSVYFILSGAVRVNMIAASGRQITYQILGAGEMFGELAAIDHLPRSASVVADSEVVLIEMSGNHFLKLATASPELALIIMRRLTELSRWLAARVFEYHAYNVKGRVYLELLRNVRALAGDSDHIHLSDRDMASRVGTTRENVTRIYGGLKARGIVSRDSTGIRVLDTAALTSLLEECEFS